MEPWSFDLRGRFDEHLVESEALKGNPLGDPHERPLSVYTPPAYEEDPDRRFPCIYVIQGMTGQLDMWRNRSAFRKNFPELTDDLFASGGAPPCVVVWVDSHYRTLSSREHRGIAGKSSGGYGAMVTPMLRPDLFSGLATHAGDALFEVCYLPEMRECARALRDHYDGSYERFWLDFRSRPAFSKETDGELVNEYAMAACYSANEDGGVDLPFDVTTGRLVPEVWDRWLAWDPVRMVSTHADAMREMRAIYIDAGSHDEYFLDLGAEAFRRELEAIGVTDVFFELFDARHGAIEYRYPKSLAYLAERLSP